MRSSFAILSVLATTVLADDVVSFFFPGGFEGAEPVATITTVNPTLTGMRIACPTGTESDECGWGNGADVSIIDKTKYQVTMTGDSFGMHFNCDFNTKATKMTCAAEMNNGGTTTGVLSGTDIAFIPATVVKGAELLSAPATATASASASASQAAKSTDVAANTGMKTSAAPSASGAANSASATSSGAVAEHTGAATRFGIEGSALLALAGVAALNAW